MSDKSGKLKESALCLLLLIFSFQLVFSALPVAAQTAETKEVRVDLVFEDVEDDKIPQDKVVSFLPDGIPFMAVSVHFNKENGWTGAIDIIPGTKSIQVRDEKIEGLESRLTGSIDEGYTISYYHLGEAPEALETEEPEPPEIPSVPPEATSVVSVSPELNRPEDDSLASQIEASIIESEMQAHGYDTEQNRQLYLIGIGVCVVLIIIVITLRILLARR